MNMQTPIEQRLWDYIDGLSSPAERSAIDTLLSANKEWQDKYRELLNVQQLLNGADLEAPSMRFTKNVMDEIARYQIAPATKTYINKNVITGVAIFFLTLITGFFVYVLGQVRSSSGSGGASKFTLPSTGLADKVDAFNWSKVFNSTYTSAFMLITAIAGLMLLDMYLQRKKLKTAAGSH